MGFIERDIFIPEAAKETGWMENAVNKFRPLLAAVAVFGGQAAMSRQASADILQSPQPIVEKAPSHDFLQVLPPSAVNVEKNPDNIRALTVSMISQIGTYFKTAEERVEATGFRISDAWKGEDGFEYIAFQRTIFQRNGSGQIALWNTLDNAHIFGLDAALDSGALGVTIPSMRDFVDKASNLEGIYAERTNLLNVHPDIQAAAAQTRQFLEIGVPTGYKLYGPYEVVRYQRAAFMRWLDGPDEGLVQGILAGDAAAAAGLIPKDVLLDKPDLGSGGGEDGNGSITPENPGFNLVYKSLDGKSEIRNFDTGLIGFKPADGGLDLLKAMLKDFGLSGNIKFVPTPGLETISNETSLINLCDYLQVPHDDSRCASDFMILNKTVDSNKDMVVTYDVHNQNITFKPGELDRINISRGLPLDIADYKGLSYNDPKVRKWVDTFLPENPVQVVGPVV